MEGEVTLVIASDIHGDLDKYKSIVEVANGVGADLVSLNGDITDRMIGENNQGYEIMNSFNEELNKDLTEEEATVLQEFQAYGLTDDVIDDVLKNPQLPEKLREELLKKRAIMRNVGRRRPVAVRRALKKVRDIATKQARDIAAILTGVKGKVAYLRGNHDMAEPVDTAFSKFYALDQKKPFELNGFKIGGFGYSSGNILPLGGKSLVRLFPQMYQDMSYRTAQQMISEAAKKGKKITLEDVVKQQIDHQRLKDEDCDVLMYHEAPGTLLKRFAPKQFHENYGIAAEEVWRKMRKKKKVYAFSGHHHKANVWTKYNAAQTDPETIYVAKLSKEGRSYITPYTWKPATDKVVDMPKTRIAA